MNHRTAAISKGIRLLLILCLLSVLIFAQAQQVFAAGVLFAKPTATGTGNCSSWANACTLPAALNNAVAGDEIWVMQGAHVPTTGTDRAISFQLKSGVAVYGGFAGTETSRDARDYKTKVSILSGEIGSVGNADNSWHVVSGSGTDSTAILDGFTITAGNANGSAPYNNGGGMYNNAGSPTLTNLTFSGNTAESGGGMYNFFSNPTLTGVTFSGNTASMEGGGMSNFHSNPTLTNVTISDNSATDYGGGMYNFDSSNPILSNVTFSGNTAGKGGGICNDSISNPTLTNVTFSNNSADNGAVMYNFGHSNPTLTNVILWGNTVTSTGAQIYNVISSTPTITNSVVEGGCPAESTCTNIIESDPKLGTLGDHGGETETISLLTGSSAIDAGLSASCPATDQRGVARSTPCDIGAYEYSSDSTGPTVVSNTVSAAYSGSLNSFTVTFSEELFNPVGNTQRDDVTNPSNFLLLEYGVDGVLNTASCATGVVTDDVKVDAVSVSYNNGTYTATVNLSEALPVGSYRLFVCGSTSISDLALNPLNNGVDFTVDFGIAAEDEETAADTKVNLPDELPETGFAPGELTYLPAQPDSKAYTSTEMILEIPALGVKTAIVSVPQSDEGWDVSWLGNSAGYLNGTAFPTWQGNTVLTGHVWDANNRPGIFVDLKTLKFGDQIKIRAWGLTYTYEVRESLNVNSGDVNKVLKHETLDWITLVTCEDYQSLWDTYAGRRVVRAVLVSVK